jgi:hypothetical protein
VDPGGDCGPRPLPARTQDMKRGPEGPRLFLGLVGAAGFEPATTSPPGLAGGFAGVRYRSV